MVLGRGVEVTQRLSLYIFLIVLLGFSCIPLNAPANTWNRSYGGSGTDLAFSVSVTSDTGYIVAGSTSSFGAGGGDALLLKLVGDGSIQWQKAIGGPGAENAEKVIQTSDGGFVIAGSTDSSGAGLNDGWIAKCNAEGVVLWQKTYGGTGNDSFSSMQQTSDGGLVVVGTTNSFGAGNDDVWVVKLADDGQVQWQKTFGGADYDWGSFVLELPAGGYILGGMTGSFGAGNLDGWLIKLDNTGVVQWQKLYGTSSYERIQVGALTSDGIFVSGGVGLTGSNDAWIAKVDFDGNIIWQKVISGGADEVPRSLGVSADGSLLAAISYNPNNGIIYPDVIIVKFNPMGALQWHKIIGTNGHDIVLSISAQADGILGGGITDPTNMNAEVWLFKMDQNGEIFNCSSVREASVTVSDASIPAVATNIPGQPGLLSATESLTSSTSATFSETSFCSATNWIVVTVDPDHSSRIDWPSAVHEVLNPGSYIKIGSLYYYVASSGGGSWNGAAYNQASLQQCNQLTGEPRTDESGPVMADMNYAVGMAIDKYTEWPISIPSEWTIHSISLSGMFDWYASQHDVLTQGTYVKIAGTYYIVNSSGNGSWNDSWGNPIVYYRSAELQQCDQITGQPLTQMDPYNPSNRYPLAADLTGKEGQAIEVYTQWPVPVPAGWTIHSVGASSSFDWYAGQHDVLTQGTYVKIAGTYYVVNFSGNGSWNDSWGNPTVYYRFAELQQCDQITGQPLMQVDPYNPSNRYPLAADLTGKEGQAIEVYTQWPVPVPSGWTIHSVGASSSFDWYAGQHDVLTQGTYVKIAGTYYVVNFSGNGSWNDSWGDPTVYYRFAELQQCDQITGQPLTQVDPYDPSNRYPLPADLTGKEGQAVEAYTQWPVQVPEGWTVHSVADPSAFDWHAGQHDLLPSGSYVRIGGTYYYVVTSSNGSWNDSWGNPTVYFRYAHLQQCDQVTGQPLFQEEPVNPLWADITGTEGSIVDAFSAWPIGVPIISINGNSDVTYSPSVILTLFCGEPLDNCTEMRFSDDGITWSDPESFASRKDWVISSGSGSKEVFVQIKDQSGLWSAPFSDTITYMDVAPDPWAPPLITNKGKSADGRVYHGDLNIQDTHTYTIVTMPAHGTATITATGVITYLPDSGYAGTDKIIVEVADQTGLSKTASIAIVVSPDWIQMSAGSGYSLALKSDGTMWGWGSNWNGQLGIGSSDYASHPVPLNIGNDNNWVMVAAGNGANSAAIKNDRTLWTWGRNNYGQLGNGSLSDALVPTQVGTDNDWLSVSPGYEHIVAIKSDGSLWTWGRNDHGQLGDGTTENRSVPVRIGTDNDWISVAGGGWHTLGLKSDGTLWGWGLNYFGELGDGSNDDRIVPRKIGNDSDWVQIAAGTRHSIALKSNGTIWAWGENDRNQLGDGTSISRNKPGQVGEDSDWVMIALKDTLNLALKRDGSIWNWGYNSFPPGPERVGVDNDWVSLAVGWHALSMRADATLWSWGYNEYGQLGHPGISYTSLPVDVVNPDVTIPIVSLGSPAKGIYRSNTPTLSYTVSHGSVQVKVDGVVVNKVSGDRLDSLTDGEHVVRVEAKNPAGTAYKEALFRVDTVAPVVTIASPLAGTTKEGNQTISYNIDEAGTSTIVSLNGSVITDFNLQNLADGEYTVKVEATDAAGNKGNASVTFIVDMTAPVITIASPLAGSSRERNHTVSYNVNESGSTVVVTLNGSAINDLNLQNLADGSYTVQIEATDSAGNKGTASVNFIVDTVAPVVVISSPVEGATRERNHIFSYWVSEAATTTITLNGAIVTHLNLQNLTDGTYTIVVEAVDAAQNMGRDSVTFIVDTTAPIVTIVTPVAGTTNLRSQSISYSTNEAASAIVTLNGAVISDLNLRDLTDGNYTVVVEATDFVGNKGGASVTFTVDTVAPTVAIISPTAGTTIDNRPILDYTVSDGTVTVKVDGIVVNKVSGARLDTLNNGQHTVRVDSKDSAGNIGSAEVAFTVNAPSVNLGDDFETGSLSKLPWVTSGNGLWAAKTTTKYGGAYSAEAPVSIVDNQSASIELTVTCVAGNVTFWYSVSSEANYDFLTLYVDGVERGKWSGAVPWRQAAVAVSAGTHSFKWVYSKDGSVSSGSDTAWIDDIVFPTANSNTPPPTTTRNEGFESGNLSYLPWVTSGNGPWSVKTTTKYSGLYSAEAPVSIVDNQSATLEVTQNCATGNVTFWYSVSSEANYDYLRFYVDGVEKGRWSGSVPWSQASVPVTAGTHTLKWVYSKDGSVSSGSDTAWIDDIAIPIP